MTKASIARANGMTIVQDNRSTLAGIGGLASRHSMNLPEKVSPTKDGRAPDLDEGVGMTALRIPWHERRERRVTSRPRWSETGAGKDRAQKEDGWCGLRAFHPSNDVMPPRHQELYVLAK
jgi:hypothetical protein